MNTYFVYSGETGSGKSETRRLAIKTLLELSVSNQERRAISSPPGSPQQSSSSNHSGMLAHSSIQMHLALESIQSSSSQSSFDKTEGISRFVPLVPYFDNAECVRLHHSSHHPRHAIPFVFTFDIPSIVGVTPYPARDRGPHRQDHFRLIIARSHQGRGNPNRSLKNKDVRVRFVVIQP